MADVFYLFNHGGISCYGRVVKVLQPTAGGKREDWA
jgi:hypothetical protein